MSKEMSELLAALGSRTRLEILAQLREPRTLGEIRIHSERPYGDASKERLVSRQAIARHLEVLQAIGLVHCAQGERGVVFVADLEALDLSLNQARSILTSVHAPREQARG